MSGKRYFTNPFKILEVSQIKGDIWKEKLETKVARVAELISKHSKISDSNCDGGIYVGIGGIAYSLYYVGTKLEISAKRELLRNALKLVEYHLQFCDRKAKRHPEDEVSFMLGSCGVYLVAGLIYKFDGDTKMAENMTKRVAAAVTASISKTVQHDYDELFVGRAGLLCVILNFRLKMGVEVVANANIHQLCKSIIESGRRYAKSHCSPCPLMFDYYDTEYLGAAHGLSSILQMLMSFPEYLNSDPSVFADVMASVDYLLSLQQPNGNFPCDTDEIGRSRGTEELVHWCHGAPGTIYMLSRAYQITKHQKYWHAMQRCADCIWEMGLLKKGPGICHGVAGNGYAFLLMYRFCGEEKYLHRAIQFMEFMDSEEFKSGARTPDCPYSLFEGLAGTLCYLTDLLNPDKAEFPIFPAIF